MAEGNLAGARDRAAAGEARVGDRVVRRSKGALTDEGAPRGQHPADGVELRDVQRLLDAEGGENGGHSAGEHGLAGTG